jgi:hypothetical protein
MAGKRSVDCQPCTAQSRMNAWSKQGCRVSRLIARMCAHLRKGLFAMFFLFHDDEFTLHTIYTLLRVNVDAGYNDAGLKLNPVKPCATCFPVCFSAGNGAEL